MTQNIKNFIEEGEKEFEEKFGKDSELSKFLVLKYGTNIHHQRVEKEIKQFISSHQISLIKMIENEISKSKKSTPLGLNPDEWEEVEAFNSVYNQALDTITSKLKDLIKE